MTVKTLFQQNGKLELGDVEVKLLPGIPQLHIVGLPDASIRECGIKLKSAMRSCGLEWPTGHQIVVSLRPMGARKGGAGVDLAIALAYMAVTDQLPPGLRELASNQIVYGEVALNGDVCAPADLASALRFAGDRPVLTGGLQREVREGRWWEIARLNQDTPVAREKVFDWENYWRRPELPSLQLHEKAARLLLLSVHMRLSVLVAGPQGSGKTTWARLLHAMMPPPETPQMHELAEMFGDEALDTRWRPLEQPHHTITPQAMIGGGLPIVPGVISRAHGGLLLMDEFLEFHPYVLESLREPVESGFVELARKGSRERFPAEFQLIGTTNLCPCGKLNPNGRRSCTYNLIRCRSVCARLSGPILDRFDLLALSHEWTARESVSPMDLLARLEELREFALKRGEMPENPPHWTGEVGLSHRRRKSIWKVARGLADLEASEKVTSKHVTDAFDLVVTPMLKLREVFA